MEDNLHYLPGLILTYLSSYSYFDQLQAEDGEDATSPTPGKTFHVFLSYYSSNSYSHTLSDDELADSNKDNVQSSHGTLAILAQFFTFQSNMFMLF